MERFQLIETLSKFPPKPILKFGLLLDPLSPQSVYGDIMLRVQGGPSFLSKLVTPSHLTLPLIEVLTNIGILRQVGVR